MPHLRPQTRSILLFVAAVLPFVASLLYFVLFSNDPLARHLYTASKLFTLVWPLAFYLWIARERAPEFPLFRDPLRPLVAGVVSGTAVVLVLLALMQTPLGEIVRASVPQFRAKAASLGVLEYYIPFAVFLAVVHSLIEEYYWRWFIFGELRRVLGRGLWPHLLAGLAFALHHIVVTTQFFPFGYGLLFGLGIGAAGMLWSFIYSRQHSLLGAWVSHMIIDLGILWVGYGLIFG